MCSVGTFRNVLGESVDGDLLGKYGILCVYDRTTYEKLDLIDDVIPPLNTFARGIAHELLTGGHHFLVIQIGKTDILLDFGGMATSFVLQKSY